MSPFKLMYEPVDSVLTIHFHNYEAARGTGSFVAHFNHVYKLNKRNPNLITKQYAAMYNFIMTYGENKINNFLKEFSLVGVA